MQMIAGRGWHRSVALVLLALGCGARERGISGQVPGGVIGDEVCAVPLVLDITVQDAQGVGIPGVEVQYRADDHGAPWWRKAEGVTNAEGHLLAAGCYQGTSDYRAHPPEGQTDIPVALSRSGFQSQTVSYLVSADAISNDRSGAVQARMLWHGVPITIRATMIPE